MMTLERQKTPFRAGEVMAALLLVQPLLDVLSYFMQEGGDHRLHHRRCAWCCWRR